MPQDRFQLFLEGQALVYDRVLAELRRGCKESHWMWFIFPQLAGLGRSSMAQRFGLRDLAEAKAYAAHLVLGKRLEECTQLVLNAEAVSVSDIFGYPDDLKFHSCMTLFTVTEPEDPLFKQALAKYVQGRKDGKTLEILERQS